MKRKFDLYLRDILQAIQHVQEYSRGADFAVFVKSGMQGDAVLRNLEIIGEAATQLQQQIKDKYPEVPWRDIQDFRIVVAHRYWQINRERIWDIMKNRLAILQQQIETILQKEGFGKN